MKIFFLETGVSCFVFDVEYSFCTESKKTYIADQIFKNSEKTIADQIFKNSEKTMCKE